jgi:outer membrane lipoprotein SlyB
VALGAIAARGPLQAPSTTETQAAAPATAPTTTAAPAPAAKPAAAPRPVARCDSCGVVESVQTVQLKGEGTGVGAVAGGIIGGVLGHQMGGGSGKDAMTVIGAVGGGVAGHEIEKRQRATTAYELRVRMSDGSLRTVTQAQALAVGQAVRVEGDQAVVRKG